MFKSVFKSIYSSAPIPFKVYLKDLFFFMYSSYRGAVNIKTIKLSRGFSEVSVLGNGPSLKKDRDVIKRLAGTQDFVCVNNFCDDDLYVMLKPKLYIFLDAYFFSKTAHPDWIERREKTFHIINIKTCWPMKIVVPHNVDIDYFKGFIVNRNIEIIKLNTQSFYRKKYTRLTGLLFDSGFYGPPQINVLIYSIYISLLSGYNVINIFGADLSFHNDVNVDQENNDLFINFRHFNESDKVEPLRKNPEKIEKWKMGELLELSANTFRSHEIINEYAERKGVKVYNCSSFSLIDAYERKSTL